jgi:GNAT superfamily N-acetyltransferase
MHIPDSSTPGGFVAYEIPSESLRFDRSVRRYILAGDDARPMVDAMATDRVDLAIVRIPTARLDAVAVVFEEFDGVLLADCLVVYTRDNQRSGDPLPPQNADWELSLATEDDMPLLDVMTGRIFSDYRNHYSANPMLIDYELRDAYREWVGSYLSHPDRACFIAKVSGECVGLATVGFGSQESEGVLYGVLPEHQGHGVYRDLIRSTVREFRKRGYAITRVSSQIDNRAVQRVWVTEGFFISHSFYTIHVNRIGP